MRNLEEYPITNQEIAAFLQDLIDGLLRQELGYGDMGPLLLAKAKEIVLASAPAQRAPNAALADELSRYVVEGRDYILDDLLKRAEAALRLPAQRPLVVTPELVKLVEDSRCFSCGNYPYQNCQRPGDKPCGREFEGGTRSALTSTNR